MAALDSTTSVADQEHQDKSVITMATMASSGSQASPRNTPSTFVQLGLVEVSKSLQDGEKFVKWDEVSRFFSVG